MSSFAAAHAAERSALTQRAIPSMTLATATTTTPAPPPAPDAASRFAVSGVAILTGGTGAIAAAVSRALLQHGLSSLMLLDLAVDSDDARAGIAALRADFPHAGIRARATDVTDEADVAAAVADTVAAFGSVDALVCLAGIVGCAHALDMPVAQWRRIMDVNATGAFVCAQAVARQMVKQNEDDDAAHRSRRGGRIVLTASISAHRVNYPQPQGAYNASKAAVVALKSCLAAEWAQHGILVNSVSPGYMDTVLNAGDGLADARASWCARNPSGRMGAPDEVAGVIVVLLSRAGSYLNGADIIVDGGGVVF
ncbi:hypothetical protein ACCO45_005723 [Purpureocillium lilacinum]|uniref:Uncharacterized protein n=1 Tax=Purpureocillium lilacinum TaxID=33203 RepID=A0ACC4DWH1_PURLI